MSASGVQRLSGSNRFCGPLAFDFVPSSVRLDSHEKHEIVRWSPLQAVCWVHSKSRQWPRVFHHWSFSTESQRGALSRNWDRLIPENPSNAIFRYPHPCYFPGPSNQLRKPRIDGQLSYSDNKKYSRELSQHSDCQGCTQARAHIFVGKLSGNGGWPGYGDWHKIFQHHYFGRYATTSPGPQSWRPYYLIDKSRCGLKTL